MADLPPLVCRPRPYPDESLSSYLLRVQAANGYERLTWLTAWLSNGTVPRSRFRPTATHQTIFLENLAAVTTIPVFDLYQMTLNRYLPWLTFPGKPVHYQALSSGEQLAFCQHPHMLSRWSRTEEATAFCPDCLRQMPYHQLPWMLHTIFACPEHNCWLLDSCSSCGAAVSIEAVLAAQCPRCKAPLADMPVTRLDTTVATIQQALMTCLETGSPAADDCLPALSVPALFRLLDGLCSATYMLGWDWEGCYRPDAIIQHPFPPRFNHGLSTIHYGSLYTSAWLAIQDWPQGFYTFLDRYRCQLDSTSGVIKDSLGALYSLWLEIRWRHPDLEPVQAAFNDYLVTHFPPSRQILSLQRVKRYPQLRGRMKLIDVRNAARLLGVSPPTIARMVRDGYVRAYYPQGKPGEGDYFVYRDDLEQGWQQRSAAVTTGQVVREFFSTHRIVDEWMRAGLISQTGSRLVRGISQPSFTRQDVDDFLDRLTQHVCIEPERPAQAITLKQVCIRNTQIGMTATQVLQRVLAGKLRAYHPDPGLQPFNHLWFHADDVSHLLEQIKAENNWIALREIPLFLHVDLKTVRRWVKNGLLVPVATISRSAYFDRTVVNAFRQRILRVSDVVNLLETNTSSLWLWAREGYLPLLRNPHEHQGKSYLFDREAIDQWHVWYVTPTEARRLLGASQYIAFRKRVVIGGYPSPVSDDMTPKFYYRTALEQFQVELEQ